MHLFFVYSIHIYNTHIERILTYLTSVCALQGSMTHYLLPETALAVVLYSAFWYNFKFCSVHVKPWESSRCFASPSALTCAAYLHPFYLLIQFSGRKLVKLNNLSESKYLINCRVLSVSVDTVS